jgi:hypothetical protein
MVTDEMGVRCWLKGAQSHIENPARYALGVINIAATIPRLELSAPPG